MGVKIRTTDWVPFEVSEAIKKLGANIRRARVRRRISQEELAQTCHIGRKTMYAVEKGTSGMAIGTILSVLWSLGLLDSAANLADPDTDEHGKILEAARQTKRVRHSVKIDNDF